MARAGDVITNRKLECISFYSEPKNPTPATKLSSSQKMAMFFLMEVLQYRDPKYKPYGKDATAQIQIDTELDYHQKGANFSVC